VGDLFPEKDYPERNPSLPDCNRSNDDFLDVTKKGVTNVHMMFEKNKKNMSYYNTPFGNLLVGINATDVKVNETEDNIDIKVDYKLEVNYEHLAECSISMNIMSKDTKDFRI